VAQEIIVEEKVENIWKSKDQVLEIENL